MRSARWLPPREEEEGEVAAGAQRAAALSGSSPLTESREVKVVVVVVVADQMCAKVIGAVRRAKSRILQVGSNASSAGSHAEDRIEWGGPQRGGSALGRNLKKKLKAENACVYKRFWCFNI